MHRLWKKFPLYSQARLVAVEVNRMASTALNSLCFCVVLLCVIHDPRYFRLCVKFSRPSLSWHFSVCHSVYFSFPFTSVRAASAIKLPYSASKSEICFFTLCWFKHSLTEFLWENNLIFQNSKIHFHDHHWYEKYLSFNCKWIRKRISYW